MSKRFAREKLFREQWLPAAGVPAATVATIPLSLLMDLYAGVYYLGPRGLIVERQVAIISTYKQEQATGMMFGNPLNPFHAGLDSVRARSVQALGRPEIRQYEHLMRGLPRLPYPDLPHTIGYIEHLQAQDRYPLRGHRDIGLGSALNMFVTMSANLPRLRKRQELREVVSVYLDFCDKWGIPND